MAKNSSDQKLPLQSKKFLAFLIVVIGWKALSAWLLTIYGAQLSHYGFMVLMTLIIVEGFFAVGYVLGQAALDKYSSLAEAAVDKIDVDERVNRLEAELERARRALRAHDRK